MLTASPAVAGYVWPKWAPMASPIVPQREVAASAPNPDAFAHNAALNAPLIVFVEPEESFLSQSIRNFGMTLATLGFYIFWARADSKKQLHRSIRIHGQRLDYTGTGKEACLSFLVGAATATFMVLLFVYFFTKTGTSADQARAALTDFRLRRLFISLPLIFLLGSAVYRRRQHLLRRTWWRGQHFDLDGHPYGYAAQHFWTAFLVPLTLGWAGPWRASWLARRKIREMHLGAHRFEAVGGVTPLYKAFAALWFGGGTIYVATMLMIGLTIGEPVVRALATFSLVPLPRNVNVLVLSRSAKIVRP